MKKVYKLNVDVDAGGFFKGPRKVCSALLKSLNRSRAAVSADKNPEFVIKVRGNSVMEARSVDMVELVA